MIFEGELARVGGFMNKGISLNDYNIDNKRFTQNAKPENCVKLFNQKLMFEVDTLRRDTLLHTLQSVVSAAPAPHGGLCMKLR